MFDLVVIGSGSAAFAAAIRARDLGASVALCESGPLGGTCVNVGCVPSKALLSAASARYDAAHNSFPGVATSAGPVDFASLVAAKDEVVAQLRHDKYERVADDHGITVLKGRGRFEGPEGFRCDGRAVVAGRFIVATGARPQAPPIPGLADAGYLTSTTAMDLTELPGKLAVIGASAIGLELGQLLAHLGSNVVLFEAMERIAPSEEPEVSDAIRSVMVGDGIVVHTGAGITRVERNGYRRAVWFVSGSEEATVEVDQVLVATGRRPNTAGLGLEAAGAELTDRGEIVVDEHLGTANPRIWAAGDVTGAPQLVYVAAAQGALAADNALRGAGRTLDLGRLPRVTFTSPQIASVGMTEAEATGSGLSADARLLTLDKVPRAIVDRDTRGLCKIVSEKGTGKVLGVHLLARGAGDVILAGLYAIEAGMTVAQLARTWAPYLTMSESLKLTAQAFSRDVSSLSCCAA
jgi:mercuric reductase